MTLGDQINGLKHEGRDFLECSATPSKKNVKIAVNEANGTLHLQVHN